MGWESNHIYPYFINTEEVPDNGGSAIATLPHRIAANQSFLACRDVEMTNFITIPFISDQDENYIAAKLKVMVPPFVRYMEFIFTVLGDAGETTAREIQLSCSDTSDSVRSGSIVSHEYSSDSHSAELAQTVQFVGGYSESSAGIASPRALKVNSSQLDYWVERQIDIDLGTKIIIMTGAYWFVPVSKATVP